MAQVSDPSASPQDAYGPLRTGSPGQNQRAPAEKGEVAENGSNQRIETQEQQNETQETRQKEDRVQISREAQDQGRESRVDEGKRNVDNLRPQREQIENERGAAQRLRDQEDNNAQGARDYDEAAVQIEPEDPSETRSNRSEEYRESRAQSIEPEETPDLIKQQAADRKNPEVQLREFQTKDEIRIEPKIVSDSVEEIETRREKAEAAKEPVLEAPSQRIIQEDSTNGSESARSAENNVQNDQEGSKRQPPNPVSVQTETGQNVDDLI